MIIKINKKSSKLTVAAESNKEEQLITELKNALEFNQKELDKALNSLKMHHYGF